jgi:3-hydroxyacyl-CoA dehydrogenase
MVTVHIIDFSKAPVGTKKRNPLNPIGSSLRSFILEQLEMAQTSPQVSAVILTSGGDKNSFSASADLMEFATAKISESSTTLIDIVTAIEELDKPVVAAVQGKALGGGMEVALSCHYCIATFTSTWGLPEVKVGMIPKAGGTQQLP